MVKETCWEYWGCHVKKKCKVFQASQCLQCWVYFEGKNNPKGSPYKRCKLKSCAE